MSQGWAQRRKRKRLVKLAWRLEDALAEQRDWGGKSGHSIGMSPSQIRDEQKHIDRLERRVTDLREELGLTENDLEELMA